MLIKKIVPTVAFVLFGLCSGCRTIPNFTVDPVSGNCCGDHRQPVIAEPVFNEPVSAPVADAPGIATPAPHPPQPGWPGDLDGLIYEWSHGDSAQLKQRGKSRITTSGVMQVARGSYLPQGINARLLEECSQSNELSLEITLMTDRKKQRGPARIVSFSTDTNSRNFTLGQDGEDLILRLRTRRNNANGTNPEIKLAKIATGQPMHIVVSYRPGKLLCCVNGRKVTATEKLRGDFHNWEPMTLIIGDEVSGGRDWQGSIERLAIRNRFLHSADAAAQFALTQQDLVAD